MISSSTVFSSQNIISFTEVTQQCFFYFLVRDSICVVRYMLSPLFPYVCHMGESYKTVEVRIMKFLPYSSL